MAKAKCAAAPMMRRMLISVLAVMATCIFDVSKLALPQLPSGRERYCAVHSGIADEDPRRLAIRRSIEHAEGVSTSSNDHHHA